VNRSSSLTGILLSLSGLAPLQAAQDPGIGLPPVSRAVLVAAKSGEVSAAALCRVSATVPEGKGDSSALELGPKTIAVAPGTTAIVVEVAIDHLNRIVTRFASPQVRTVSEAITQVEGNAV
jgi:hypothetical protein